MDSGYTITLLLFAVAGVLFLVNWYLSSRTTVKRNLAQSTGKHLSEVIPGETVKIIGKVIPVEGLLSAPFSQRPSVFFRAVIERYNQHGHGAIPRFGVVHEEEKCSDFLVKEGETYAYVRPGRIKAYLAFDPIVYGFHREDLTPAIQNYLKGLSGDPTGGLPPRPPDHKENLIDHGTYRFSEGHLEEGSLVGLSGQGIWRDATELGLPARFGKVLEIQAPPGDWVYLSDDPEVFLNFKETRGN